jgi:hypothetical protein
MSHFKKTNRFDDMKNENEEHNPYKKQNNNQQRDRNYSENSFRSHRQNYRDRPSQENRNKDTFLTEEKKKEIAKLKKQKETETLLQESNFPELISSKVEKDILTKSNDTILFADRIKQSIVESESNSLRKDVKPMVEPGWVSLSFDLSNNNRRKIQWDYGPRTYMDSQEDESYNVLCKLVELNEKHRTEYIEYWGDEEYEKMFKMPNYDYAYFERLDELHEEEMQMIHQEREEYNNYIYEDNY